MPVGYLKDPLPHETPRRAGRGALELDGVGWEPEVMTGTPRPVSSASTLARGFHRLRDPRVWGTVVGASGATVFVMENRGELANPWPVVAALTWAGAFFAYAWFVFVEPRVFIEIWPVGPRAGITYLGSVVGMLVLIHVGTALLADAGRDGLRPAVIVVAVGLHFIPFAAAFHTPMFKVLGSVMAVLGAAGFGLGWIWGDRGAAAAAVVAGVVMLVVITADAGRSHRRSG